MIDRRLFLSAPLAALAACAGGPAITRPRRDETALERFEAIRATLGPGARLGVAAIDTASGRRLLHDADSRYAMASTFKLPLAACTLFEVQRGALALTDELPFGPGDPLPHSPVVSANLARGRLTVERLCAAIVEQSDNSAANILLRRIGGPAALTAFARACDDEVTRLDRYELDLNSNLPGDARDTTSPAAMAGLTERLAVGRLLQAPSRRLLAGWLLAAVPGPDRLRAGFPADWRFGHKTGSGARGAVNDLGVAWPPGSAPIVIASYQDGGDAPMPVRAAAHAAVARLVVEVFGLERPGLRERG